MNRQLSIAATAGVALGLLVTGIAIGRWWAAGQQPAPPPPAAAATAPKVLYWFDPMYPDRHFDKPGKSPFMDMELVPKLAPASAGQAASEDGVRVDGRVAQSLGVRTARVESIVPVAVVEASGRVGYDQREVTVLQALADGRVEAGVALAPGDIVRRGQPLLRLRIPEWSAALAESRVLDAGGDATLAALARARLQQLGIPQEAIDAIAAGKAPPQVFILGSPRSGVIEAVETRDGMAVGRGQPLLRIQGLDPVWLDVAVPEAQAVGVAAGDQVEARLDGDAARSVSGRVLAVLPALQAESRTVTVRVGLRNADLGLRPGQSARVRVSSRAALPKSALAVPTEALIRTGKRVVVVVAGTGGHYRPVEVVAGQEVGDRTVILSGLVPGEEVLTSGQFLIDSEASLSGVKARTEAQP